MKNAKKGIFRLSVTYFLLLLVCILLSLLLCSFLSNLIGFIPNVEPVRGLLNAIMGVVIEILFVLFFFYKVFYNDRYRKLSVSFAAFGIACILQFLLAFLNHFYPYTAGYGITEFGYVFYLQSHDFEMGMSPSDIPVLYFIIPLLILDIILFGVLYSAFLLARRKQKKETEKLLKETQSPSPQE